MQCKQPGTQSNNVFVQCMCETKLKQARSLPVDTKMRYEYIVSTQTSVKIKCNELKTVIIQPLRLF